MVERPPKGALAEVEPAGGAQQCEAGEIVANSSRQGTHTHTHARTHALIDALMAFCVFLEKTCAPLPTVENLLTLGPEIEQGNQRL